MWMIPGPLVQLFEPVVIKIYSERPGPFWVHTGPFKVHMAQEAENLRETSSKVDDSRSPVQTF